MEKEKSEFAYVGKKSCGCIVCASVDEPKYADDNAKSVARWIKDGLTVERLSCDEVRIKLKACRCNEPKGLFDEATA